MVWRPLFTIEHSGNTWRGFQVTSRRVNTNNCRAHWKRTQTALCKRKYSVQADDIQLWQMSVFNHLPLTQGRFTASGRHSQAPQHTCMLWCTPWFSGMHAHAPCRSVLCLNTVQVCQQVTANYGCTPADWLWPITAQSSVFTNTEWSNCFFSLK